MIGHMGHAIGTALRVGAHRVLGITVDTPCGYSKKMEGYTSLDSLVAKHGIQLRDEWIRFFACKTEQETAWTLGRAYLLTFQYLNRCCACGDSGVVAQVRMVVASLEEEEDDGVFTWWVSMQEVPVIHYINCETPASPYAVGEALAVGGA